MSGWIKLWRKSEQSQVFQNESLWRLWTWCLMRANHEDAWVYVQGLAQPVRVLRGQFITGRFSMHKALYPKKKKANPCAKTTWRWLETLGIMQNLSIQTSSRYSLVTIGNYDNYQSSNGENVQVNVQPVSSPCPAGVQPVSTNKNDKNEENDKKIVWSREDGWANITPEHHTEWVEAFPAVDIPRQLAAMAVWCRANPAKARKSNWARFIANWLTKAQDRGGDAKSNPPGGNGESRPNPTLDLFKADIAARQAAKEIEDVPK